jgi:hypothetical protein
VQMPSRHKVVAFPRLGGRDVDRGQGLLRLMLRVATSTSKYPTQDLAHP